MQQPDVDTMQHAMQGRNECNTNHKATIHLLQWLCKAIHLLQWLCKAIQLNDSAVFQRLKNHE
jgi:hypothetical protein